MDDVDGSAWIEQVAEFFARQEGLPPITGRILGWLMICEPPEQSAAEIAAAGSASPTAHGAARRTRSGEAGGGVKTRVFLCGAGPSGRKVARYTARPSRKVAHVVLNVIRPHARSATLK